MANNDQNLASLRDTLPPVWWALFSGCLQSGFTEAQSLVLLQTFILSHGTNGIRPNQPPDNPSGPSSRES